VAQKKEVQFLSNGGSQRELFRGRNWVSEEKEEGRERDEREGRGRSVCIKQDDEILTVRKVPGGSREETRRRVGGGGRNCGKIAKGMFGGKKLVRILGKKEKLGGRHCREGVERFPKGREEIDGFGLTGRGCL